MNRNSFKARRVLVVGVVSLGIAAAGALPAFAGGEPGTASGECSNGSASGTERTILVTPAYLATEYGLNEPDGSHFGTICYSDTPHGAPSHLAGGFVHVREHGTNFDAVWCNSDPGTTVAANCYAAASLAINDPNPGTPGGTVSGYATANGTTVSPAQTGAEIGTPSAPINTPLDGDGKSGAGVGLPSGTCVYANGSPVYCPSSGTAASETYNEGDGPKVNTTGGTGVAVWVGESNDDTLTGTVGPANVPYRCLNVGSPAPGCPRP